MRNLGWTFLLAETADIPFPAPERHSTSRLAFSMSSESETENVLAPSFVRAYWRVLLVVLIVLPLSAVNDRYRLGHWWDTSYWLQVIAVILLFPLPVYLMFTPREIRWSFEGFEITPRLGQPRKLSWTELLAYGDGRGVFMLQFANARRIQFFAGAFDPVQWRQFKSFLEANHPGKKPSWFATWPKG